jgi:hypothetical protein
MLSLQRYVYLFEGGAGGHMAHPFDYTDFTANDLIELVNSLFKGKVEHLKEKLDGMNINASMNNDGEIIFIRNNTERNSEKGGILLKDLDARWDGKEHQKKVFMTAGKIIEQIFPKVGKEFFNPDETHRKIINCECIIAGKTNIMPYAKDRVAFHGYTIWEWNGEKWLEQEDVEGHVDELYKAAEGIDEAKPRPDLMIKNLEEGIKFAEKFTKAISKLWEDEGLNLDTSIEEWKKIRFKKFAPEWCKDDDDIFNRMCNDDKSVNANLLKKRYPEHKDEIPKLDKELRKEIVGKIMEPMDNLFLAIGNELIDQLDGFINSGAKDKITQSLKADLEATVEEVEKSDSVKAKEKLEKSLNRLKALGDKYNAAEGIVIMYKGRRLKMTGSFAPMNQALGTRFELEK